MNRFKKITKGFTLIELLITIALIGVIAGGVMMVMNPLTQFQKSRDAQRKSDLRQIQNALEGYYNDNGEYPLSTGSSAYNIKDKALNVHLWGDQWAPYIAILPKDPSAASSDARKYIYISTNNNQGYRLYASLERASDSQVCNGGAACTNVPAGTLCGTTATCICNYGVTSPNTDL
jgi:prepilin-type N-terminal cleavage/methylation domain-containing protein